MNKIRYIFCVAFCCLIYSSALAQDSSIIPMIKDSNSIVLKKSKSPFNAVLYSFIFPGSGQLYVESYWKAPLAAGAAGFFIYQILHNHSLYTQNADAYNQAIANGQSPLLPEIDLLKRKREFYNNNRDINGLYLLAVYGIAAVDAYVGAHLFDFDISDDLSMTILPHPINNGGVFSARITF